MGLLWRRHKGGRHAGLRAGTAARSERPAPFLPLHAAVSPVPAAPPPPVPVAALPLVTAPPPLVPPPPAVSLVFDDGRAVTLDAADPRTKTFLLVAGELLRPAAGHPVTRSG